MAAVIAQGHQVTHPAWNGGTFEILGISNHPAKDRPWWLPDGTPATHSFLNEGVRSHPSENQIARELVARLSNFPNDVSSPSLDFGGGGYAATYRTRTTDGKNVDAFHAAISMPRIDATTLRVGIATGPWQILADSANPTPHPDAAAVFSAPFLDAKRNQAAVHIVRRGSLPGDVRIVALDTDGKEHFPNGGNSRSPVSGSEFGALTYETSLFPTLPSEKVKSFQLKHRPYAWAEFQNVQLNPAPGGAAAPRLQIRLVATPADALDPARTDPFADPAVPTRTLQVTRPILLTGSDIASAQLTTDPSGHPVDAFPDTTPAQVQINTVAPALGPEETERQITAPVEQALRGMPHLENVRSSSKSGLSQVVVTFADGTEMDAARNQVSQRLETVQLPAGIARPQIVPLSTGFIIHFTLAARAADSFKQVTSANVSRQLAILFDGKLVSAPTIQSAIDGNGAISFGPGQREEAQKLAALLKAPAPTAPTSTSATRPAAMRFTPLFDIAPTTPACVRQMGNDLVLTFTHKLDLAQLPLAATAETLTGATLRPTLHSAEEPGDAPPPAPDERSCVQGQCRPRLPSVGRPMELNEPAI